MKKILTILSIIVFSTSVAYAAPYTTFVGTLLPVNGDNKNDIGTSTSYWRDLFVNQICLAGDCKTTWPAGGGGGGDSVWSRLTTTNLIYAPTTTDTVAIGGNSTTSAATEFWFDPGLFTNGVAHIKGRLGIGTTSPYAPLSVAGQAVAGWFTGTSTTQTNTFPLANITKLSNLTGNGFVKTSGNDGTLSIDTTTYLSGVTADSPLSGAGTSASHLTISTAGTWSGNAGTATKWASPITINGTSVDGSGNVTITAASSTLLANNNTFSGNNTFSNTITGSISGNAGTASALAANPTNCTAGNYPLGIDASGNVENCTTASAGGGGTGNVGTSSVPVQGNLAYWTTTTATPALLGTVATGTVSSGTGISVTAGQSIIGSGLTITNTAPDQTVVLNNGTNVTVTGTYPTFTINSTGGGGGGGSGTFATTSPYGTTVVNYPYGSTTNPYNDVIVLGSTSTTTSPIWFDPILDSYSDARFKLDANTGTSSLLNVFIGAYSGKSVTTGLHNVAIGDHSMRLNTTGQENTFVGYGAGYQSNSYDNVGFGNSTLYKSQADHNTAVGQLAGFNNIVGSNNTFLGTNAGYNVLASSSIIIGAFVDSPNTTTNGVLNIGNVLYGSGMYNAPTIGPSSGTVSSAPTGGFIGIGTTTPGTMLSVGSTGVNTINISPTATSTFGSGIDLRSGCFSINGTCVGGGSGSGSVTSVDMSVPTGLSISGNPITTSGTLALTYTAGYSIPTTLKQTSWDNKWDLASSTIPVNKGGTGATTLTGCLTGNGTGAITGSGTCNTSNASVSSVATNNGLTGGTITTTGTIGLNTAGFYTNALMTWNGSNLVATGTPNLTAGYFTATSTTATSTFAGDLIVGTAVANSTTTMTVGDAQLQVRGCINIITYNGSTYATSSLYMIGATVIGEANPCR